MHLPSVPICPPLPALQVLDRQVVDIVAPVTGLENLETRRRAPDRMAAKPMTTTG